MKRNSLILETFLLISMALVSCGGSKGKVSFFYFLENDNFITSLNAELYSEFSKDYEVESFYGENKQSIQNKQFVKEIEKNKPKLIIMNIVDRLSARSFVEISKKNNTPIIFINREPLLEDVVSYEKAYYVGTDPIFEGRAQAEIADSLFTNDGKEKFALSKFDKNKDGKLQIYLVKGEQGHQDTEERSKHSLLRLNELGYDIDLIHTSFCDWDREKAHTEFSKIYKDTLNADGSTSIELLLSNNDDMALGCVDFLKQQPQYSANFSVADQYFPIIGVNGTNLGINAVLNGELYGTVKNDSSVQSDAIYKLGCKLINQESLENFQYKFDTNGRFIHVKGQKIVGIK